MLNIEKPQKKIMLYKSNRKRNRLLQGKTSIKDQIFLGVDSHPRGVTIFTIRIKIKFPAPEKDSTAAFRKLCFNDPKNVTIQTLL